MSVVSKMTAEEILAAGKQAELAPFVELLGSKLVANGKEKTEISTAEALKGKKAVALYFSAHWCPPCRGFTPKLAGWYKKDLSERGLEVIFVSSDRDDSAFSDYFGEQPWLALPFSERSIKGQLSKQFKVQGIPSLVILDGPAGANPGKVITTNGREAISEDPTGKMGFPWYPKPLLELLGDSFLQKEGTSDATNTISFADAVGKDKKTFGLYFSAHWCPPCRGFTPKLAETYKKLKASDKNFEIIFVSSDQDKKSFDSYFGEMPWLALPFAETDAQKKKKKQLSSHFDVSGIPHLVILGFDDETGELRVVREDARGAVGSDPEGENFPWVKQPVNEVNADCDGIDEAPSVVLLQEQLTASNDSTEADKAEAKRQLDEVLKPLAEKFVTAAKQKGDDESPEFNFFYASDKDGRIAGRVRDSCDCKLADSAANKWSLVLMDIEDNGAYYKFDNDELTLATLEQFLTDYQAKKLTRCQMSG